MKTLFIALTLLSSSLAFSGEILLSNKPVFWGNDFDRGQFVINEELGRAWIELDFSQHNSSSDMETDTTDRIKVAGMSFDNATQEVIIEDEYGRTVCAVQRRGFLGVKRMRATGNCNFVKAFYTATFDTGFEIRTRKRQTITLVY